MDISALTLGQATPRTPTVSLMSGAFAALLAAFQSGAPPGSTPPPAGGKVGEEVANLGPIALSLNPDFLPTQVPIPTQEDSDGKSKSPKLDALAAMMMVTVSLQAMQTVLPVVAQGLIGTSTIPKTAAVRITPPIEPSIPIPTDHDLARGPAPIPSIVPPIETSLALVGTVPVAQIVAEAPAELNVVVMPIAATPKDTPKVDSAKPTAAPQTLASTPPQAEKRVEAVSAGVEVDDKLGDKALPGKESLVELPAPKAAPLAPSPDPGPMMRPEIKDVQPLPRRDVQLVIRQIVDRIELMAATKPRGGVTVQLQPEHLGTITMTVKSAAGAIEAHISASNENVRTALDQNQALLGQSLEQRGLKLENVSVASQTNSSTTYRQPQQQPQPQPPRGAPSTSPDREIRISTIASPRLGLHGVAGVDLWI